MTMEVQVYAVGSKWAFKIVTGNRTTIANSNQLYARRQNAISAERLRTHCLHRAAGSLGDPVGEARQSQILGSTGRRVDRPPRIRDDPEAGREAVSSPIINAGA
jgi:hypothetical protein